MLIYLHIGQLDDRYIPLKHAAEHDRLCPARWCGVGLAPTNYEILKYFTSAEIHVERQHFRSEASEIGPGDPLSIYAL